MILFPNCFPEKQQKIHEVKAIFISFIKIRRDFLEMK